MNERKGINPLTQIVLHLNSKVHQQMGRNRAKIKFGANYQFHFMNILVHLVGEEKIRNLHNHQNFKAEKLTKKYH